MIIILGQVGASSGTFYQVGVPGTDLRGKGYPSNTNYHSNTNEKGYGNDNKGYGYSNQGYDNYAAPVYNNYANKNYGYNGNAQQY